MSQLMSRCHIRVYRSHCKSLLTKATSTGSSDFDLVNCKSAGVPGPEPSDAKPAASAARPEQAALVGFAASAGSVASAVLPPPANIQRI